MTQSNDTTLASDTAPQSQPTAGRGRIVRRIVLACVLAGVAFGGHHFFWRYHVKRLTALDPNAFYRVAQPTEFGLRHLVKDRGVRTILSVQRHDWRLAKGLFDPGEPDGSKESEYVRSLGAQYVQWPMGDEACWPWPTPWQFEEFFKLIDNPENLPVAVHCMGGRHRTGTLSALYRLEYDRWEPDAVLKEMHSFDFGDRISVQEHNLRTYLPRPRPGADQWRQLQAAWSPIVGEVKDFESLVCALRKPQYREAVEDQLRRHLRGRELFSIQLAQRLIESPDDPLARSAARAAMRSLQSDASEDEWAMAAALVADFGKIEDQRWLLDWMEQQRAQPKPSNKYEAVVAGVTNRYTANRVAYLIPMLEDTRQRIGQRTSRYRYCDTAVARIASIVDENPMWAIPDPTIAQWDFGRQFFRVWLDSHRELEQLTTLVPPTGKTEVLAGDGSREEDLKFLR